MKPLTPAERAHARNVVNDINAEVERQNQEAEAIERVEAWAKRDNDITGTVRSRALAHGHKGALAAGLAALHGRK